jgi:ribose-phosphate pyrophosphokinase
MKLLACNSNINFARNIAKSLNRELVDVTIKKFADSEIFLEIHENVRGEDIFVIQSTSFPANHNIMELLICIDALKRASARRITAVIPYFGYARQDRKPGPRTPISAKLVADILTTAGADRVLTIDLHAGQIQGFFNIPVDNLYSSPLYDAYIQKNFTISNSVVVSPDIGGVARARKLAKNNKLPIAIVDKRRKKPGLSEIMHIIGDIEGKDCIIIDDIIDSGGTLCNAANALIDKGAKSVVAFVTHAVLSGDALTKVGNSKLKKLVVTDTIENDFNNNSNKIEFLSCSELFAKAIDNIANSRSVSHLFD